MFARSTKRKGFGTTLVLGVAFVSALTTGTLAASSHHKGRRHVPKQAQESYARSPYHSTPFAPEDPTLYAIKNRIPVPDKTLPGFYPKSPAR